MRLNKLLLLVNIFFLQSYLLRFSVGGYPSNLQEALIGLQVIVFLYALVRTGELWQTIKNIPKHWVLLSFALLTIISIVAVPVENDVDFFRHAKFLLYALALSFIFLETFKALPERMRAIKIMGWGAVAFGLFSVFYNLLGYNVAYDYRLQGPLDSAVYLAYYLTPFLIFFSLQILEKPKQRWDLVAAMILALLIMATRSMGAIAGSFVVIGFYCLKRGDIRLLQNRVFKILVVLLGLFIAVAVFYSKILPSLKTVNTSLGERDEIWLTSFDLLKQPKNWLFGVGFGQFEHKYIQNVDRVLGHKPLDYYILQPHNLVLLFIFQYGILGLLFILFCIFLTAQKLFHPLNLQKNLDAATAVVFILLYFFIHGMIDTPFFKNDLLILLILFLEMGLGNNFRILSANLKGRLAS